MSNEPKKPSYEELEDKVDQLEKKLALVETIGAECFSNGLFLQTLLDTIPSPIFYKDKDGIYQNCNDAFSKMILGIPKEKIINKSLFDLPDLIPHELAKVYYEKDRHLFDNPGTQIYQGAVKCSDEEIRVFSFYKATVEDDESNVVGLVGVMLDVTELENKKTELSESNSQLESFSFTDSLTGLFNRRKFNQVFGKELKESKRHEYMLNFAMIDVDNFKLFNDTYGHLEGDYALKTIADSLQKMLLRPDDYVFRLGGEEFGLLFSSKDESAALTFVKQIRSNIQLLEIEHLRNSDSDVVTISLGLVSITQEMNDVSEIYRAADNLLYKAKHSGKNKVVSNINNCVEERSSKDSVEYS